MRDDGSPPGPRPSLAKTRAAGRSFGALVGAAATDPAAARGLAAAYASLPASDRRRLLDAVVSDARTEGISPAPVLASLLPAEPDVALAGGIAAALVASDTRGLRPRVATRALLGGDAERGAVLLALPLYGDFAEVLTLGWDAGGLTHAYVVPLVRFDHAAGEAFRVPPDLPLADAPVVAALDLARAALWRHRRLRGALPEALDRFADVLGA